MIALILSSTLLIPATFVRSYDGDTITVNLSYDTPEVLSKEMPVRVRGIDTPEMTSKIACELDMAKKAKALTASMFMPGEYVSLSSCERDKYFRLLCDVKNAKGQDLGTALILSGLAVPYFGGTKRPFSCLKE